MNTKSFLLSGILGAIVYFLLGWLFYGVLFPELHGDAEPCMWMIALGCLFMALLISLIYNRWASITTFSTGFKAGFAIGFLYSLSMNFFMYSSKGIDTDFFILLAIETISLAIVGGVVGYANGLFGKKS
jgi:hypothetical protein